MSRIRLSSGIMHLAHGTPVRSRFQPSPVARGTGGFACPRLPEAARLHPRCPSPTRRQARSRPDSTEPPVGQPGPSLTHVMFRNSLPFHAGFLGKATPAGLRPSVIPPHLRPLSSTGITPRLQSYGPLRHPAGPACPSRGSGCRVHGTGRTSVLLRLPSSMHADATTPAETAGALVALFPAGRRPSPNLRRVGFRDARIEACSAFTFVPACMVARPPKAALLSRGLQSMSLPP